jgi:hypothetical protein
MISRNKKKNNTSTLIIWLEVFFMRKLVILSIFLFLFCTSYQAVGAAEYLSFQETEFRHDGMRFLEDYTQAMYDKYYPKVEKRRFWGWRTYTAYKTEPISYTKETLYVIHNEGTTAITETFSFQTGETVKKQYSVSGSIGLEGSGPVDGFKLGLESNIDHDLSATITTIEKEDVSIKVMVDPGTHLSVQIKGEGKVSNGVASYFVFWKRIRKGGWEIFVVTTEYYSIVKETIES